jgi:hypothetical protein
MVASPQHEPVPCDAVAKQRQSIRREKPLVRHRKLVEIRRIRSRVKRLTGWDAINRNTATGLRGCSPCTVAAVRARGHRFICLITPSNAPSVRTAFIIPCVAGVRGRCGKCAQLRRTRHIFLDVHGRVSSRYRCKSKRFEPAKETATNVKRLVHRG